MQFKDYERLKSSEIALQQTAVETEPCRSSAIGRTQHGKNMGYIPLVRRYVSMEYKETERSRPSGCPGKTIIPVEITMMIADVHKLDIPSRSSVEALEKMTVSKQIMAESQSGKPLLRRTIRKLTDLNAK